MKKTENEIATVMRLPEHCLPFLQGEKELEEKMEIGWTDVRTTKGWTDGWRKEDGEKKRD